MTGKTSIEWATAVWNPTTGCTRVSAGCNNCYAFALHDKRHLVNRAAAKEWDRASNCIPSGDGTPQGILDVARAADAKLPYPKQYDRPFSRVQLLPDRLDDPLRHRKPERYFVDSMADLFHDDVPDDFIQRVFITMGMAKQHTFLVLTKRPERMRAFVNDVWFRYEHAVSDPAERYPVLPNVWLGTSVEDQAAADERIPHLLATPAAVRFLSCEPLLGPVDLSRALYVGVEGGVDFAHSPSKLLDWVIVGGESGERARPMNVLWVNDLVEQCRAVGVAVFVKQLGAKPYTNRITGPSTNDLTLTRTSFRLRDRKGGDMAEWPEDLRVREFPR